MTIANFKQQAANFMNRTLASLTADNSQDMLLAAMNDARRAAQRDHEFEMLRTENAFLTTSAVGANWQTGCKTTPGGSTAILMRRIDEVWNYATETTPSTYYPRSTRIDFSYSGQFKREMVTVSNNMTVVNPQSYYVQNRFAYCVGPILYVTTQVAATQIQKLVGIQWLDDLVDADSPDIFLLYHIDWFRYATIAALNVYLKDGERFPIDAVTMERLWKSVKNYDGGIANMGESMSLD